MFVFRAAYRARKQASEHWLPLMIREVSQIHIPTETPSMTSNTKIINKNKIKDVLFLLSTTSITLFFFSITLYFCMFFFFSVLFCIPCIYLYKLLIFYTPNFFQDLGALISILVNIKHFIKKYMKIGQEYIIFSQ